MAEGGSRRKANESRWFFPTSVSSYELYRGADKKDCGSGVGGGVKRGESNEEEHSGEE